MIIHLFQAIGAVLSLLVITITVLLTLYLSYILGIGVIIVSLIFVAYHIISTLNKSHK